MERMNIGVNVTRSFLRYTYVLLRSIFENHRDFSVQVYVFSGNVEEVDLADIKELASFFGGGIRLLKVDEARVRKIFHNPSAAHPVYMHTFYFMFDLLPEDVDRLLVLDSDMIVKGSLREFYTTDFGDSYAVCTNGDCMWEETTNWKKTFHTLGVSFFSMVNVLFYVDAIRRDFTLKDIAQADDRVKAVFGRSNEEWGFALLFHGRLRYVSEQKYGLYVAPCNIGHFIGADFERIVKDAVVIHYFRNHPWEYAYGTLQTYWWKYAKMSPYYEEFLQLAREAARPDYIFEPVPRQAAEQFFLDAFVTAFDDCQTKRILLYGIGGKTESLLKHLSGWNFVGVTEEDLTPKWSRIYGYPVIRKEEIGEQADMIVVVARLCYFDEIAKRIRRDPLLNQYPVYYLDGRKIC